MRHRPGSVAAKREPKTGCTHYWIIESPMGPTSTGKCKFCGAVSDFRNYVPYESGEDQVSVLARKSSLAETDDN